MKYQINENIKKAYQALQGVELSDHICDGFLAMYCKGRQINKTDLFEQEKIRIIETCAFEELREYGFDNIESMYHFVREKERKKAMTINIYGKSIEVSESVCSLYTKFVGMPLDEDNLTRLAAIYLEEFHLSIEDISAQELATIVTEMMCDEICANMGEAVENAKAFLEAKGYL